MNWLRMINRNLEYYLALLVPSFFAFAVAWAFLAPDRLYHCWDDAPPFMISWWPPFIHPWANSGNLRDYFIWPAWLVYFTWLSFTGGIFLFPAVAVWLREKGSRSA